MRRFTKTVWCILGAGFAAGCSGGDTTKPGTPTAPPAPVASQVQVTPATGTVAIGASLALSAQPLTAGGAAVAVAVTWTSSSPTVATVDAAGRVTGVAAGQATITATAGSASGSAVITVVPPLVIGVGPQIATLQLPSGQVGVAYSQRLAATGGDSRYLFTVTQGRWPSGLTFGTDGLLTGTPTAADSADVTIRVTSAGVSSERTVRLVVNARDPNAGGGSCSDVWEVSATTGGVVSLAAPTAGSRELCVRLPRSASGRSLVVLTSDTWAGFIGSTGGDAAQPQLAYEFQPARQDARAVGTLQAIPNPALRPARLWTPIVPVGALSPAPTTYTWIWNRERVPTRLVYSGVHVNYYEDTTAAPTLRGTAEEWRALDSLVTKDWARLDTLYGPLVDLDRDGKFAYVAMSSINGSNAYYSACALAPGWTGSVSDTASYGCGSEKTRDHAVFPLMGRFRQGTILATVRFIGGTVFHESIHARQHMLTLQVPGRDARENRCGMVMFFMARPTMTPGSCGEYAPSIRSTLFVEGMASSVVPVILNDYWTRSCLSGALTGGCNLDRDPYNSGQLFAAWMILRAGRSIWPEILHAGLSSTTAFDAFRETTGIAEGTWTAMFLASLMLDDSPQGERLGLHWPGMSIATRMGFSSPAAQWSRQSSLGNGGYDAARLEYGGGMVLRVDHASELVLRLRAIAGGNPASVLVIPEVAK